MRPRRLFGLIEPADGAPRSRTGLLAPGARGLPSAAATRFLHPGRDEPEIQGTRTAASRRTQNPYHRSRFVTPAKAGAHFYGGPAFAGMTGKWTSTGRARPPYAPLPSSA